MTKPYIAMSVSFKLNIREGSITNAKAKGINGKEASIFANRIIDWLYREELDEQF